MTERALLDINIIAQLLICVTFLLVHRPSSRLVAAYWAATGLIWVVLVYAIRNFYSYTRHHMWDLAAPNVLDTWVSIALGWFAVGMSAFVLIRFLAFRHQHTERSTNV